MKILWDKYKTSMIITILSTIMFSREKPQKLSKAERTISKTMLIPYEYNGVEYEMVVPVKVKKAKKVWHYCIANLSDGTEIDVTVEVKPKSGPYGDFFGIGIKASHLITDAETIHFYTEEHKKVFTLEN